MRFRTVEHFNEYQIPQDSPMAGLPQVAIVGRSNSGKSTLLNALVEQRHAARTSATARDRDAGAAAAVPPRAPAMRAP